MGRDGQKRRCAACFHISIHAPRVGRDNAPESVPYIVHISIHAPRVGRDNIFALLAVVGRISIHAPRVGRDSARPCRLTAVVYFNPRAPCGARRCCDVTPATRDCISIHAPRVGRDTTTWFFLCSSRLFQSTRPVWGATLTDICLCTIGTIFQSTRPVWGATRCFALPMYP